MSTITLTFDEAEAEAMAQRASRRGYASAKDYLRALVAADMLIEALREDWQDADEDSDEIEHSFRESWHDAMTDHVFPVDSLWDDE